MRRLCAGSRHPDVDRIDCFPLGSYSQQKLKARRERQKTLVPTVHQLEEGGSLSLLPSSLDCKFKPKVETWCIWGTGRTTLGDSLISTLLVQRPSDLTRSDRVRLFPSSPCGDPGRDESPLLGSWFKVQTPAFRPFRKHIMSRAKSVGIVRLTFESDDTLCGREDIYS
jgi:hypothetical protein